MPPWAILPLAPRLDVHHCLHPALSTTYRHLDLSSCPYAGSQPPARTGTREDTVVGQEDDNGAAT